MMQWTEILKNKSINQEGLNAIRGILDEHEYSGVIHAIYAKSAFTLNDPSYDDTVRQAAIRVSSRKLLHNFIYPETSPVSLKEEIEIIEESNDSQEIEVTKVDEFDRQLLSEAISAGAILDLLETDESLEKKSKTNRQKVEAEVSVKTEDKELIPESASGAAEENTAQHDEEIKPISEPSKMRFSDWMNVLSDMEVKESIQKPRIDSQPKTQKSTSLAQSMTIIEHFIENEDSLVPKRAEFYSPAKAAKQSLIDNTEIVSETLAKVYASQGSISKAVSTYEKLSLLHPEKSAYFAALIEKLKTENK
jgi:hypothetical protein